MAISVSLRQQVRLRANGRCEYCHSPEKVSAERFEIDHTHPRSHLITSALTEFPPE